VIFVIRAIYATEREREREREREIRERTRDKEREENNLVKEEHCPKAG
jgi:hypothetical protein